MLSFSLLITRAKRKTWMKQYEYKHWPTLVAPLYLRILGKA